jgi:hypothetical protein
VKWAEKVCEKMYSLYKSHVWMEPLKSGFNGNIFKLLTKIVNFYPKFKENLFPLLEESLFYLEKYINKISTMKHLN